GSMGGGMKHKSRKPSSVPVLDFENLNKWLAHTDFSSEDHRRLLAIRDQIVIGVIPSVDNVFWAVQHSSPVPLDIRIVTVKVTRLPSTAQFALILMSRKC